MNIVKRPIDELKLNPDNPRHIKQDKYKKLVASIREFPEMLDLRPIVVDSEGIVLGGNMRLRACKEAGLKEVPVIYADQLTEEQKREFIIKDNVGFGEWDWDVLGNEWDPVVLDAWGLDVPFSKDELTEMANPDKADTENPFATEIDKENNYVVLKFDTDIDWIQAKTLLGLRTETARRANGKPWSSGIGRVLDGPKAIAKLSNAN